VGIAVTILIALVAGAVWAVALRGLRQRRQVLPAPRPVSRVLKAYTAGRWDAVISNGPACLELHSPDEPRWRPAVELALGHALTQRDRWVEAIDHLESGLALQAASRVGTAAASSPDPAEAKMRHMLGFALASTGQFTEARRQYERALVIAGNDDEVIRRVESSLKALDSTA
jgi:tetratricopeptide (TPR) repeat protein